MQGNDSKSIRHYLILAAACIVVAAGISVVLAFLIPSEEAVTDKEDPVAVGVSPTSAASRTTIQLASTPVEVNAEQLQSEILDVGTQLLERFPRVPEALHIVAMLYADLNKAAEAKKIWQQCVEMAPNQPGPYIGLATVAMELGQDETAVKTLRQALAVGCSTPELYHQLAAALMKLGQLDEAADVSRQGLKAFPDAAKNWCQLGQVQLQLGQPVPAEISLRKAIAEGDSSGGVLFALATACARQGKHDEAARYREEFAKRKTPPVVTNDEEFQSVYDAKLRQIAVATICRAGVVYDRHGDVSKAESLLLRASSLDPTNPVVCVELAAIYRRQDRLADGQLVQRRLIEIEPRRIQHYVNLASLSLRLGDKEAAETALKQVVSLRPDLAIGYSSLAKFYLQSGRIKQARWFAEAALRQDVNSPRETIETYMVFASACNQLGDRAAAEDAVAEAKRLRATIRE